MNYLHKRKSVYYLKVSVPLDLLQFFPSCQVWKSLKTRNHKEAKTLLQKELVALRQSFFEMRYQSPMTIKPPSKRAVEIFLQQTPNKSPYNPSHGIAGATLKPDSRLLYIQQLLDAGYEPDPVTGTFTLSQPPANDPISYQQAPPVAVSYAPAPVTPPKPLITVKQAIKEFKVQLDKDTPNKHTMHGYFNRLDAFEKHCKSVNITDMDNLTLSDIFNENLAADYKPSTLKLTGTVINMLFKFCKEKKYIDDIPSCLLNKKFIKETLDEKLDSTESNEPYTTEQLNIIFSSFVINNASRNTVKSERLNNLATIYACLLMLYSAVRIHYTNHLLADNCNIDADIPNLFFKARKIEAKSRGVEFDKASSKTVQDFTWPIHKDLIALGLNDYLVYCQKQKRQPFKESTITSRYRKQLKHIGIQTGQLFHSFRSTCDNQLRLITTDTLKEHLMQHSPKGSSKPYKSTQWLSDTALPNLNKVVQKLNFKIDFSKLKPYLKEQLSFFG